MLQRVLVAIDFSPASGAALAIAREHCPGATRRLVTVIKPSKIAAGASGAFSAGSSPLHVKNLRQVAEDEAMAKLAAWAREGEERMVVFGNPAEEISRHAEEWAAQLIVMGTRGRSQIVSMLSGSATEWLVRHSRLPVMVVHDVPLNDSMREKLPPGL